MKEIDRIHFQSREHKVMFRHLIEGGTVEYTMEDYEGKVLASLLNPKISFEVWTIRQTEKLLDWKEKEKK